MQAGNHPYILTRQDQFQQAQYWALCEILSVLKPEAVPPVIDEFDGSVFYEIAALHDAKLNAIKKVNDDMAAALKGKSNVR